MLVLNKIDIKKPFKRKEEIVETLMSQYNGKKMLKTTRQAQNRFAYAESHVTKPKLNLNTVSAPP